MVKVTGKTVRPDAVTPINLPSEVKVNEDAAGLPAAVAVSGGRRQAVIAITDRWRLDDEWWRNQAICRLYYVVILSAGQRLVLYKDLVGGGWYKQDGGVQSLNT